VKAAGFRRTGLIVVVCVLAGALAGIAGSAAAPSKSKPKAAQKHNRAMRHALRAGPMRGPGGLGLGGPPVHAEMVVPNANGDGFDTVTMDSGKLKAISGSSLTITEGTDKATYGEPTVDAGSSPTVVRNHQKAALGDLQVGDFVHVIRGPKGTFVMAEDAATHAQEKKDRGPFGHDRPGHPGGPPPADRPGSNG
jgi:hypothetical protein